MLNRAQKGKSKSVAVIVAHPDDETLWAGGTILSNPSWKCYVVCLCRKSDTDRAPKFYKALKVLKAEGTMGDIDDGPEQLPLNKQTLENAVLELLPPEHFDLVITHDQNGEYTRHLRHEETGQTVTELWQSGEISTNELWTFAYEDGKKQYYPKPVESAAVFNTLTKSVWLKKYQIITKIYGYTADSWEAKSTSSSEAFRKYTDPKKYKKLTA